MVVKFERGLGHLARIVPHGRHAIVATYPTVGHVDTRPGHGTVVARSELANLNWDAVFTTPGPPPRAVAVITVPSSVLGRRRAARRSAMQPGPSKSERSDWNECGW